MGMLHLHDALTFEIDKHELCDTCACRTHSFHTTLEAANARSALSTELAGLLLIKLQCAAVHVPGQLVHSRVDPAVKVTQAVCEESALAGNTRNDCVVLSDNPQNLQVCSKGSQFVVSALYCRMDSHVHVSAPYHFTLCTPSCIGARSKHRRLYFRPPYGTVRSKYSNVTAEKGIPCQ